MASKAPKMVAVYLTNFADPAREEEYNRWHTNIHVPDAMETPGYVRGTRYKLATDPAPGEAKYLVIYEIDTDDVEAVQKAQSEIFARKRQQGRSLAGLQQVAGGFYRLISDNQKKRGSS